MARGSAQPTNADPPGCRPLRCRHAWDEDPPGCSPLWDADPRDAEPPPPRPHPRSGQLAGGTHPTGMHTCVVRNHVSTPCLLFTLIIFNFQLFLLVMFYRSTAMHLVHLLNPMLYSNIIRIFEI